MATNEIGQVIGLGSMTGGNTQVVAPATGGSAVAAGALGGSGGGGGASAQDGLNQISGGSDTVANAISKASEALSGGFKKGGSVKKYTSSGGKLNLGSGRVSTASKNSKQSNW